MNAAIADVVHPILQQGIALRTRLDAGESLDWDRELAELKRCFAALLPNRDPQGLDEFDFDLSGDVIPDEQLRLSRATIRYALTCWVDDFVRHYSKHGSRWREYMLETDLYGTSEGATKFWDEARYAETRGDLEALEVMRLCVMLGFRGEWRAAPMQVETWAERTGRTLERTVLAWAPPAALEPTRLTPRVPRSFSWRGLTCSLLLTLSLLLPATAVFFWRRWPL